MTPPLYSGPRCASCGGDHFPDHAPTEDVVFPRCRRGDADVDPDTAPDPNGPQTPVWDASRAPSTVSVLGRPYLTLAGLRRWLRRNS